MQPFILPLINDLIVDLFRDNLNLDKSALLALLSTFEIVGFKIGQGIYFELGCEFWVFIEFLFVVFAKHF